MGKSGRLYCDDQCRRKARSYRRVQVVKARNGLRTLIVYFTCAVCGNLGIAPSVGRLRKYHPPCYRVQRANSRRSNRLPS
jgi:hypothetical protein